jgi:hypothetical protein
MQGMFRRLLESLIPSACHHRFIPPVSIPLSPPLDAAASLWPPHPNTIPKWLPSDEISCTHEAKGPNSSPGLLARPRRGHSHGRRSSSSCVLQVSLSLMSRSTRLLDGNPRSPSLWLLPREEVIWRMCSSSFSLPHEQILGL